MITPPVMGAGYLQVYDTLTGDLKSSRVYNLANYELDFNLKSLLVNSQATKAYVFGRYYTSLTVCKGELLMRYDLTNPT